ncbi:MULTISPECIES: phosphate/phosphite/phosphonate ABC transporter substrate-binding protein [unclassified Anabaena]|uniref:phosphate/phosphite/phosphonate ABC transporter substrate-binding protein n=1 Tax=unclassified Anabaena TaxID=2619674 RepID=UPI0014488DE8|nr:MULTISPECIES: PhnD/SsuA/transferrin family substrate-binding protein [unclassified Anabaena]MTJ07389.1 phosphate/phosphite/phosphonate ABC transporter substrate-binding protein [Anabaena sp. UHCC 0204]MTJ52460.1 phosphate/phosphite/phosphonate ABC transporter substrate-binding protein [Anabaena sp. UHCC 0253]
MDKLNLMVCPHDTAKNPDRWFRFAQYLSQNLDQIVHFELALDFQEFHQKMNDADIVYGNPADTMNLLKNNFISVARPSNLYDEVVFIAHHDLDNPSLESFQGSNLVSVVSMLATKIGLNALETQGIKPAELIDKSTWLAVIKAIANKETDAMLGFVYKDTYEQLGEATKSLVKYIATSQEKKAFHQLVLSSKAIQIQKNLASILLEMKQNSKGKDILDELNIEQWMIPTESEIDAIKQIIAK